MNILKSAAIVAVGLMALAGCQKATVDTSADEAAIRAATAAWAADYNAGNAEAVAAHYAEDGVLQPPDASSASGRAAIAAFIAADSAKSQAAGLKFVIPGDGPIGISGDLAYEAGSFSVADSAGATVATGKYIGVFNRIDGKWLLVRDTYNMDAPAAPAPAAEGDAAAEPAAG